MPSISLTSPHAMVIYSPDRISVTQGSSFSVTCSTHSIYPGGVFHLMKSDMKPVETKLAFGHFIFYLANFELPDINNKDQGEYTCVYAVNISSLSFCSAPSKSLQVTVTGKIQKTLFHCFYSDYCYINSYVVFYSLQQRRRLRLSQELWEV